MGIRSIMFDLDGTLIDSAPDIQSCLVEAFFRVMRIRLHFDVRTYLGPTIFDIIKVIPPYVDDINAFKVEKEFRSLYDNSGFKQTIPYQGVNELIDFLNQVGIEIFIVTNKPIIASRLIVDRYFDGEVTIATPDSSRELGILSKTEMIAFLINKENLPLESILFVGDTAGDVIAAHANGVRAIGVSYGYGDIDELYASQPDFIIDDLMQLKPLIRFLEG